MSSYGYNNEDFNISWNSQGYNFDTTEAGNLNSEEILNFQSFDGQYSENFDSYPTSKSDYTYMNPATPEQDTYGSYPGTAATSPFGKPNAFEEEEEPPLLEELGIFPDKIMGKTLMVLNPLNKQNTVDADILYETDLAGPITFCVLLGACLLLAGSKAHFGYVYGHCVIGCILMYCLLSLMTTRGNITFGSVASILGYCLLPVTVLSLCGIFLPLYSPIGLIFSFLSVLWSSISASKLFVIMSGDSEQRSLIAYPCALLYGTFALIVVF